MNGVLLVLIIVVVAAIGLAVWSTSRNSASKNAATLADAKAVARRTIDFLGGQVINLSGTDDASKQALADASERFNAAGAQIDQATTAKQALLAKESAMEGLYYVRAARTAMGMDPGPELESLSGQKSAGTVTEDRASNSKAARSRPHPPDRTHPELLPRWSRRGPSGSRRLVFRAVVEACIGRGRRGVGSVFLFSALFSGMGGVGYDAQGFEQGYGDGYGDGFDAGQDGGGGDYGDGGGDMGGDGGGWGGDSWGGGDSGGWGGGDFGGGDFGGDFGGF